jgi:hypothetical protein
MNKKIEELMYHAGLTAQGCWDEMDEYDRNAIETFAELIVLECVTVLDTAHEDARLSSNFGESLLALLKCFGQGHATYLKEHFGVVE